jgi:hypothetical protein
MSDHRTAVILFGIAVAIVIGLAAVTTWDRKDTLTASNEAPAGATGLARPHPPLDRAPGEAIPNHRSSDDVPGSRR